jgi:hypothetical protein
MRRENPKHEKGTKNVFDPVRVVGKSMRSLAFFAVTLWALSRRPIE